MVHGAWYGTLYGDINLEAVLSSELSMYQELDKTRAAVFQPSSFAIPSYVARYKDYRVTKGLSAILAWWAKLPVNGLHGVLLGGANSLLCLDTIRPKQVLLCEEVSMGGRAVPPGTGLAR